MCPGRVTEHDATEPATDTPDDNTRIFDETATGGWCTNGRITFVPETRLQQA